MRIEETRKIIGMLNANYEILSGDEKQDTLLVGIWDRVLQFYDYKDVGIACGNYITNNRIKPKPSDIKAELDCMQAKRHSTYKQIENIQKLDCEAKLTRQNLLDVFNSEFAPFRKMNLPPKLREELISKNDQKSIDDFVTKVWSYLSVSDFQIFHIEMALGGLRGTKLTFEKFMKKLVHIREFADNFNENKEDNISKCKQYLNQLKNKMVAQK